MVVKNFGDGRNGSVRPEQHMIGGESNRRRRLTADEHRARAQRYRREASSNLDRKTRQELILLAIKHEVIAEELVRVAAKN
jgi:hypothetical protein